MIIHGRNKNKLNEIKKIIPSAILINCDLKETNK